MADVFLSYKREDKEAAQRLAYTLGHLGFDVWWDFELLSGQAYRKVIREIITKCKAAVVLWSARAVDSDFVMDEASFAKELGKLCPARIDATPLPLGFASLQTEDLSDWQGSLDHTGFQRLLGALEARIGRRGMEGSVATSGAEETKRELDAFRATVLEGSPAAWKEFVRAWPRGQFAAFAAKQLADAQSDDTAHKPEASDRQRAQKPRRRLWFVVGTAVLAGIALAAASAWAWRIWSPKTSPVQAGGVEGTILCPRARAAVDAISDEEWQHAPSFASLIERVVEASSVEELTCLANSGNSYAQFLVGRAHDGGVAGFTDNEQLMLRYFQMSADAGNPRGQFSLGLKYQLGEGVAQNFEEAARLYRLAADQGLTVAMNNLGGMYERGEGVEADDTEAVRLYREAADLGNVRALNNLGRMHEEGRGGLEPSLARAIRHYRLAAEQGLEEAQLNLRRIEESPLSELQEDTEEPAPTPPAP